MGLFFGLEPKRKVEEESPVQAAGLLEQIRVDMEPLGLIQEAVNNLVIGTEEENRGDDGTALILNQLDQLQIKEKIVHL